MSVLVLRLIEIIDTNNAGDLFTQSDSKGIAVVIKQIELIDGETTKTIPITKKLVEWLSKQQIPINK